MKAFAIVLLLLGSIGSYAQNAMDSILISIEQHNSSLTAIRAGLDAEKTGNKTGLLPPDPQVEVGFLEGSPAVIGNRTDLSVKQSFDFPTAYAYRHQLSGLQASQLETEFLRQKAEILHQARQLCAELSYQNALIAASDIRCANARRLLDAYQSKFDHGDCNLIDLQKVQINFLNYSKEREKQEINRKYLLAELTRLNGGLPVFYTDKEFFSILLPADFETWYAEIEKHIPEIGGLEYDKMIQEKKIQLQRSLNLPKFSAGYTSETVVGQAYRGASIGISVPVWENRNKLQYAKALSAAADSRLADARLQYREEMKALFEKANALKKSRDEYKADLMEFSNENLLRIALDKGEISLSDYLLSLSYSYESNDQLLEMEKSLQQSYIELLKYSASR